eukprot:m.79900 g.79900  ORF g.79900 m.79900 type:complete len:487 (+) comp12731_c0_seq3:216-1676(+)
MGKSKRGLSAKGKAKGNTEWKPSTDFRAADLQMSNEELIALMDKVREASLSVDDAVALAKRRHSVSFKRPVAPKPTEKAADPPAGPPAIYENTTVNNPASKPEQLTSDEVYGPNIQHDNGNAAEEQIDAGKSNLWSQEGAEDEEYNPDDDIYEEYDNDIMKLRKDEQNAPELPVRNTQASAPVEDDDNFYGPASNFEPKNDNSHRPKYSVPGPKTPKEETIDSTKRPPVPVPRKKPGPPVPTRTYKGETTALTDKIESVDYGNSEIPDPEGDYTDAERDETYEMVDPALVDGPGRPETMYEVMRDIPAFTAQGQTPSSNPSKEQELAVPNAMDIEMTNDQLLALLNSVRDGVLSISEAVQAAAVNDQGLADNLASEQKNIEPTGQTKNEAVGTSKEEYDEEKAQELYGASFDPKPQLKPKKPNLPQVTEENCKPNNYENVLPGALPLQNGPMDEKFPTKEQPPLPEAEEYTEEDEQEMYGTLQHEH